MATISGTYQVNLEKIIGILKHLSKFLPLKTLNQMNKALVRSHLDYCDVIYHQPASKSTTTGYNINCPHGGN